MPKTTISVFRADVGSFPGNSRTHPKLIEKAQKLLREEKGKLLIDSFVTHCGAGLELIMTHSHGLENDRIHRLAGEVFASCGKIAGELKLYGAGPAAGDTGSACPVVAGIEFAERESDPVLVFLADKARPGAWNIFLYRIFADPFNTPGLVSDPAMQPGFDFDVHDMATMSRHTFRCPEESYRLLACIREPSRYVIRRVLRRDGEVAACTSARSRQKAGKTAYEAAPVMLIRAGNGFPAVGEALEPFCTPALVEGWLRDSLAGPLVPVGLCDANCTRSDGPPRATCLGFQVNNGELIGPADMFNDPAFDRARSTCNELADLLRAQGPFGSVGPRRSPHEEAGGPGRHAGKRPAPGWEKLPE